MTQLTCTHKMADKMDGQIQAAKSLLAQLKKLWNSKSRNLKEVGSMLQQLKVSVVSLRYLPTGEGEQVDPRPLVIARDALEIGAFWSIETDQMGQFEHYMAQLKAYYFDYETFLNSKELGSVYMHTLLGLNLMFLLSESRLAEFHAELERLPPDEIEGNVYISYPVKLEQNLMEGSYQKIFMLRENVPDPHYAFFVNKLLHTIKDEIASCAERSYNQLSVTGVREILQLESEREAQQYAEDRGWQPTGEDFFFQKASEQAEDVVTRSGCLLQQSLTYAKELERIV